jgi:RNA polymerase sigma-70 factor (ECF subfamily)
MAGLDGFSGFRGEGSLRAWLLGIARKRCARRLEARGRERELRRALPEPEPAPSPERVTLAARAQKLLSEVRPSEREALILRFSADLSFREVAEACGVDEPTARKRASRGLARLRELFGEK